MNFKKNGENTVSLKKNRVKILTNQENSEDLGTSFSNNERSEKAKSELQKMAFEKIWESGFKTDCKSNVFLATDYDEKCLICFWEFL